ncbi:MAG: hypothetical protein AB7L84_14080 [Acidimicrobiia bacterium]
MEIVAALFIDSIDVTPPVAPGGPTKLELGGVHFSALAPSPPPFTVAPHLVVVVRCRPDEPGTGALEVVFTLDDEQIARNAQPLSVEPGKFSYRLVRAELDLDRLATVEALCRIDGGPVTTVPYTLLPPGEAAEPPL